MWGADSKGWNVGEQFVTCSLDDVIVGEPLPCAIYVYIDFRFITFRAESDVIDSMAYDRLQFKKVKNLFILEQEREKFLAWGEAFRKGATPVVPAEYQEITRLREVSNRKMMDIFQSTHPDRIVAQALDTSKKLVMEVMKFPFAVQPLSLLASYSRGTVDHSVNVSILASYLAMQMGYSHQLILQHVGMGGLLHDIGKPKVPVEDSDSKAEIEAKLRAHPSLGVALMESQEKVPKEVKMIIEQHHECYDGSGYPKKLRGSAIYDLARIVSIANVFDGLVANTQGPLVERQRKALRKLDEDLYRQFDPQKLDKALKILKLGV